MGERRRARSGSELEGRYGYCRAVAVGDRVLVSGTAPTWPGGECDPGPEAQARRCCEIIVAALEELGAEAADVVRTRMFITDPAISETVGKIHGEFFAAAEPAATMVVVAALLDPRWLVEIEAEAYRRTDR
jgi:enamine deaminase RidA (YjgF/YER057c/UK114 family)